MDSGLNINHVDIETGRLSVCGANFIPSLAEEQDLWVDANLHGTHVTATIAGNGAAERRYAGMAPLVPHIRFAKVLSSSGFGFNSSIFPGMDYLARPSSCEAVRLDGRRRRAADREHEPVVDYADVGGTRRGGAQTRRRRLGHGPALRRGELEH